MKIASNEVTSSFSFDSVPHLQNRDEVPLTKGRDEIKLEQGPQFCKESVGVRLSMQGE